MEGEDLSAAQYLIAAIIFFVPAIKAMGIQSLPRVKQSLQGWRRLCPPQSRLPVPFEVVALVFLWAVESNRVQLGFHLLLSFMLYLRPGEALGLRIKDVVPPSPTRKIISLDLCVAPAGDWPGFEDTGVRRDRRLRLTIPCWRGSCPAPSIAAPAPSRGPESVHAYAAGFCRIHRGRRQCPQPAEARTFPSIPPPTRRGLPRFREQASRPHRDPAPRALEKHSQCQAIPKRRPPHPAHERVAQASPAACNQGGKQAAGHLEKATLIPARSQPLPEAPFFLEVFSGSGRLATACAAKNGWPVRVWDIQYGSAYDLCRRENQCIFGWLRSGQLLGIHLGTPCSSFSRARDRKPGPPPLRSDSHPLGMPELLPADMRKVRVGNSLMRFTVRLAAQALQCRVPLTIENPRSSRLWLCPGVLRLLRRSHVQAWRYDFCMFGERWKKPTQFVGVGLNLELIEPFCCTSTRRSTCASTRKRHFRLVGQAPDGRFWTAIAEPYPKPVCAILAKCFRSAVAQRRAHVFASYI